MTDPAEPSRGWAALPRWTRIGILALAAVVVALILLVLVRIVSRAPAIPLGVTPVAELRPGSCLAESALDLDEYTVVSCSVEHPQQVFAVADLDLEDDVYALVEESLAVFGDEVCDRYLEYRLFLAPDLEKSDYTAYAIAVPSPASYAAGETSALCAVSPDDGGAITGDLHRPMP